LSEVAGRVEGRHLFLVVLGGFLEEHDMRVHARLVGIGLTAAILGVGFVAGVGGATTGKNLAAGVQQIAADYAKGDTAAATKQAKTLAGKVDEIEDLMHLFSYRKSKGLGVGPKPGAVTPDGIEAKIMDLAKKQTITQKQLDTEADALLQMAYVAAAIGEVAHAKPPEKDEGKKKKSDWLKWSADMRDSALKMASAVKEKKPAGVLTAVKKLNSSCNACHAVFKDS
jgi:hypothetical protein